MKMKKINKKIPITMDSNSHLVSLEFSVMMWEGVPGVGTFVPITREQVGTNAMC